MSNEESKEISINKKLEFHKNEFQSAYDNNDYNKAAYEGRLIVEFTKKNYGENHANVAKSYNNLAIVHKAMDEYDKAIDCYHQSLNIYRQIYIETHPTIAKTLKNISSLYNSKGDYKKSIEYYEDHLFVSIKAMGDKHPYIGETCNNIALLCMKGNDYKEAINYYIRSLNIFKKVYGENHIQVAQSYKNLGQTYKAVHEYDTSLENYNKCLQITINVQGENSLDTAKVLNELGSVYDIKELYDKAIHYYNKSLEIRKKVLGDYHLDVAVSYNNLGTVHLNKSEYDTALEYYQKDLEISTKILGEVHPDVATTYNNIGLVYDHIGNYKKAIEYYQKDLEISIDISGRYHADVATSYNNIGLAFLNIGDYNKAFEHYNYSVGIYRKIYGDKHSILANGYINLATSLTYKKRFDKALEFYNGALKIRLENFGENSIEVAHCYHLLGDVHLKRNELDNSFDFFNKSLTIRINILGEKNSEVAETIHKIGYVYYCKKEYDKSIECYNKSLAIQYKIFIEFHPDIALNYQYLGKAYESKNDYNKVLFYYEKALAVTSKTPDVNKIDISVCYSNLGRIYSVIGEYDKAIDHYDQAIQFVLDMEEYQSKLAEIYKALGIIYIQKAEYESAIDCFNKALNIFKIYINQNRLNIARCYEHLGITYFHQKDYTKAIVFFNNSLSLRSKIQNQKHPDIGNCYFLLGLVYKDKLSYKEALEHFRKSAEIFLNSYDKNLHIHVLGEISCIYELQEQYELSIQQLETSVSIVEKYKFKLQKYKNEKVGEFKYLFYKLFSLYIKQEKYEQAYLTQERMRSVYLYENLNIERVLMLGQIPQKIANQYMKLYFDIIRTYELYNYCLNDINKEEEAIETFQKLQSLETELEKLNTDLIAKYPSYGKLWQPKIPSIKEIQFKLQIYRSYTSSNQTSKSSYKEIARERFKNTKKILNYCIEPCLNNEIKIHVFLISEKDYKYYFLGSHNLLTLEVHNFREILSTYPNEEGQNPRSFYVLKTPGEKEYLLSFHNSEEFILGKKIFKTIHKWRNGLNCDNILNYSQTTDKHILFSQSLLGTFNREMDIEEANSLFYSLQRKFYDLLVLPLEDELDSEEISNIEIENAYFPSLVIIPDNLLYYFPFSSLRDQNDAYLIQKFNFTINQSVSLCFNIMNRYKPNSTTNETQNTKPILIFGNPIYKKGHISNISDDSEKTISKGVNRGLLEFQKKTLDILKGKESIFMELLSKLVNLPGSSREISELKRLVKQSEVDIYTGVQANKDELYKLKEENKFNYKIIYFSALGLFFSEISDNNSIVLSSRKKAIAFKKKELRDYETKINGNILRNEFLKVADVFELGIKSELIVLSSCEFSIGDSSNAEGITNLQHSFLSAGANSVVFNLWPIDDEKTIRFMNGFISLALENDNESYRIFCNVQRKFIKMGNEYSDPFFWSSFVLYGI